MRIPSTFYNMYENGPSPDLVAKVTNNTGQTHYNENEQEEELSNKKILFAFNVQNIKIKKIFSPKQKSVLYKIR